MKAMRSITVCAAAAAAALLSACASRPGPAPAPERAAPVRQAPPPVPAPPPVQADAEDWRDLPLAAGDWTYDSGAKEARYGDFSLRCDPARGQIVVARAGAAGSLRLRTTYGERTLPAGSALAASDPLLDDMAFSRGRFTIDAPGRSTLVLPAWPEPARVVEDCRG